MILTQEGFGGFSFSAYLCSQMKQFSVVIWSVLCLLTACQKPDTTATPTVTTVGNDSAAIYQSLAYQETFNGSLSKAESYANRAFLLSQDSIIECNALSILCYIYYREGRQKDLELLMQTISPEMYVNVMDMQLQVEQDKAGRQQRLYGIVIVLLLLMLAALGFWYYRRMKSLTRLYQQRITTVREKLEISETKTGVDVLYAIINNQNISQMGKQEEQAVQKILPLVDATLADALSMASSSLTPKETFFCIMEYYGKSDHQKARSFCCSEQAIRSTKSRLNKKIDIAILRSE